MKKNMTITIDEDLLEQVKKHIPNASQFIEDAFKAYINFTMDGEEKRGEELRQAWEDFNQAKLTIHLLTKVDYAEINMEKAIEKQKSDAWMNVWGDYRNTGTTLDNKIQESSKTLELEPKMLSQLLTETLMIAKNNLTKIYIYDNWNYIEEHILPDVEIDDEEEIDIDEYFKNLDAEES